MQGPCVNISTTVGAGNAMVAGVNFPNFQSRSRDVAQVKKFTAVNVYFEHFAYAAHV